MIGNTCRCNALYCGEICELYEVGYSKYAFDTPTPIIKKYKIDGLIPGLTYEFCYELSVGDNGIPCNGGGGGGGVCVGNCGDYGCPQCSCVGSCGVNGCPQCTGNCPVCGTPGCPPCTTCNGPCGSPGCPRCGTGDCNGPCSGYCPACGTPGCPPCTTCNGPCGSPGCPPCGGSCVTKCGEGSCPACDCSGSCGVNGCPPCGNDGGSGRGSGSGSGSGGGFGGNCGGDDITCPEGCGTIGCPQCPCPICGTPGCPPCTTCNGPCGSPGCPPCGGSCVTKCGEGSCPACDCSGSCGVNGCPQCCKTPPCNDGEPCIPDDGSGSGSGSGSGKNDLGGEGKQGPCPTCDQNGPGCATISCCPHYNIKDYYKTLNPKSIQGISSTIILPINKIPTCVQINGITNCNPNGVESYRHAYGLSDSSRPWYTSISSYKNQILGSNKQGINFPGGNESNYFSVTNPLQVAQGSRYFSYVSPTFLSGVIYKNYISIVDKDKFSARTKSDLYFSDLMQLSLDFTAVPYFIDGNRSRNDKVHQNDFIEISASSNCSTVHSDPILPGCTCANALTPCSAIGCSFCTDMVCLLLPACCDPSNYIGTSPTGWSADCVTVSNMIYQQGVMLPVGPPHGPTLTWNINNIEYTNVAKNPDVIPPRVLCGSTFNDYSIGVGISSEGDVFATLWSNMNVLPYRPFGFNYFSAFPQGISMNNCGVTHSIVGIAGCTCNDPAGYCSPLGCSYCSDLVCSFYPNCCSSSGWSADCVELANDIYNYGYPGGSIGLPRDIVINDTIYLEGSTLPPKIVCGTTGNSNPVVMVNYTGYTMGVFGERPDLLIFRIANMLYPNNFMAGPGTTCGDVVGHTYCSLYSSSGTCDVEKDLYTSVFYNQIAVGERHAVVSLGKWDAGIERVDNILGTPQIKTVPYLIQFSGQTYGKIDRTKTKWSTANINLSGADSRDLSLFASSKYGSDAMKCVSEISYTNQKDKLYDIGLTGMDGATPIEFRVFDSDNNVCSFKDGNIINYDMCNTSYSLGFTCCFKYGVTLGHVDHPIWHGGTGAMPYISMISADRVCDKLLNKPSNTGSWDWISAGKTGETCTVCRCRELAGAISRHFMCWGNRYDSANIPTEAWDLTTNDSNQINEVFYKTIVSTEVKKLITYAPCQIDIKGSSPVLYYRSNPGLSGILQTTDEIGKIYSIKGRTRYYDKTASSPSWKEVESYGDTARVFNTAEEASTPISRNDPYTDYIPRRKIRVIADAAGITTDYEILDPVYSDIHVHYTPTYPLISSEAWLNNRYIKPNPECPVTGIGSCCYIDGVGTKCENDFDEFSCFLKQGQFEEGVNCQNLPGGCSSNQFELGACCIGTSCTDTVQCKCTGDWDANKMCDDNPCSGGGVITGPPGSTGACCKTDVYTWETSCSITTEPGCSGPDPKYAFTWEYNKTCSADQGVLADCMRENCCKYYIGACCLNSVEEPIVDDNGRIVFPALYTCLSTTPGDCDQKNGRFIGFDKDCYDCNPNRHLKGEGSPYL